MSFTLEAQSFLSADDYYICYHTYSSINQQLNSVSIQREYNARRTFTLLSYSPNFVHHNYYIKNQLLNKHWCALFMTYPYFDHFKSNRLYNMKAIFCYLRAGIPNLNMMMSLLLVWDPKRSRY